MKSKYTTEERLKLLELISKENMLTIKEEIVIPFWEIFKPSKLEVFYDSLKKGYCTKFAFLDAKNYKKK